eukprot:3374653-Rhodomonas_salina.2
MSCIATGLPPNSSARWTPSVPSIMSSIASHISVHFMLQRSLIVCPPHRCAPPLRKTTLTSLLDFPLRVTLTVESASTSDSSFSEYRMPITAIMRVKISCGIDAMPPMSCAKPKIKPSVPDAVVFT